MTARPEPATVFVTNMSPDHNYGSAEKFGALRPVTSGNYPVFKSARLLEEIASVLAYSSPTDFLLFSGSSFVAGICLATWLLKHKECHALLYDRTQRGYVPRVVRKDDIIMQLEKTRDRMETG